MARRRMFSSRVTESTRFIKMPATSQNLYFHLGMHADDDGIVEAYPVMCMIGSTEDDLRVLISKGFATLLNEDMVTFINDWLESNNIRADRKVDSIYKELLVHVLPSAEVKQAKESYYSKSKNICQTNDSIGKDRLGKGSIDKNILCSLENERKMNKSDTKDNFQKIYDIYPKKVGKAKAYEYYLGWLKGRNISGTRIKLTNRQMYIAVRKYVQQCEINGTEIKYYKNFDTLMNKQILDYVEEVDN